MQKDGQIKFHSIVSKSALFYGTECWTVQQNYTDIKRIGTSEMTFLQSLAGLIPKNRINSVCKLKKLI